MRRPGLLLLLVACAGPPVPTATDPTGGPLDEAAYRFCHDTDEPVVLSPEERVTYCALAESAVDCPGLRAACARDGDTDIHVASGGCGSGGGEVPAEPQAPPPPPPPTPDLSASEVLVEILRWTLAFAVALLAAGLLFAAVRAALAWLSRRPEDAPEQDAAEAVVRTVAVPEPDALPEAPSGDLLAAARSALDEGRFDDVALLCRGASLRALGETGRLRLHPSRTDREYVRALRRVDGSRHEALRTITRAVERLRWGGRGISPEQARAALEAAGRILAVVVVAVLVVGWTEPTLAGPAQDYAPSGSAALRPLFEQHGFDVTWRLRSLRSLDVDTAVVVVDADRLRLLPGDEEALRTWVEGGGVLVLAGEAPVGFPELGRVGSGRSGVGFAGSRSVRDIGLELPLRLGGTARVWDGADGVPWVVLGERPVVQSLQLGQGAVLGLADARYLTNGALAAPENAAFVAGLPFVGEAMGLYGLADAPTLELATIAGATSDANNPLASLSNARLLPLVLQILLIVALIGLWRGWPFGPPRDPPREGRLAFAEHARALGERFRRVQASRHVAAAQAGLALARLGPVTLQAAAERQGYAPAEARDFVARVQALADAPEGPDSAADLELMEELWRITRA